MNIQNGEITNQKNNASPAISEKKIPPFRLFGLINRFLQKNILKKDIS